MKFKLILKICLVILMLIYPAFIYFGLNHFNVRWLALMILALMSVRAIMLPNTQRRQAIGLIAIGIIVGGLTFIFNDPVYLRFYPVLMSILMLGIFLISLAFPPTVIEVFARIGFKGRSMPEFVITYTRSVTKIWCGFFVFNACIATLTIFASWERWALYNGFISYILMGFLFAGEFAYRHLIVKKRHPDEV